MPRIVAFFACSVVCVASTLPTHAEERAGVVETIDAENGIVMLSDGTRYLLPHSLDSTSVHQGMQVHLLITR